MSRSSAAASKLHHQHSQNIKVKVSNLEVDYTCCLQKLKRHLCRKKKNQKQIVWKLQAQKKENIAFSTIDLSFAFCFFVEITNTGRHLSVVETSRWWRWVRVWGLEGGGMSRNSLQQLDQFRRTDADPLGFWGLRKAPAQRWNAGKSL